MLKYSIRLLPLLTASVITFPLIAQQHLPAAGYQFGQQREIIPISVNCDSSRVMLERILDSDQQNRRNVKQINEDIDFHNQCAVVSLIEKCGWPTKDQVGQKGMIATFLVLQHASADLRQKYFPLIKESAEKGDLRLRDVAMMEDRMLMESGKKQKYGTQVMSYHNGPMRLHPVEDPANLNKRRAEMGMESIEEYLKRFGIEYKP